MRVRAAGIAAFFACALTFAADGEAAVEPDFLWRITVEPPAGVGEGLTALRLYPELFDKLRYIAVAPEGAPGRLFPWRLETAAGAQIASSYMVLTRELMPEADVLVVFPAAADGRRCLVTAYAGSVPPDIELSLIHI